MRWRGLFISLVPSASLPSAVFQKVVASWPLILIVCKLK
nr:MAG TPA: hypothetical protein [Caudoviricetes sp.]DAU28894.1 MAG TPA: hypothetical protein [Caudoviricetes sp.]